jgi:hypothetical protein
VTGPASLNGENYYRTVAVAVLMSSRRRKPDRPDWVVPALRCGLELTLVVLNTAFLATHLESALLVGLVVVAGTIGAVGLLFWCVKEHVVEWIRYASQLTRWRRERRRSEQ